LEHTERVTEPGQGLVLTVGEGDGAAHTRRIS
jgi:hypothetical protein